MRSKGEGSLIQQGWEVRKPGARMRSSILNSIVFYLNFSCLSVFFCIWERVVLVGMLQKIMHCLALYICMSLDIITLWFSNNIWVGFAQCFTSNLYITKSWSVAFNAAAALTLPYINCHVILFFSFSFLNIICPTILKWFLQFSAL